jgi:hypothetical protein
LLKRSRARSCPLVEVESAAIKPTVVKRLDTIGVGKPAIVITGRNVN